MAGLSVGGEGRGGRKSLDSEINMIPMIDLLMVTVSFLLITAVWSTMSRIDASAQTAGDPNAETPPKIETRVHVEVKDDSHFTVSVRDGASVLESHDVEDRAVSVGASMPNALRYEGLARDLTTTWASRGNHRAAADLERDTLVLHAGDDVRYETLVRVMDAADGVKRDGTRQNAFRVTFATH
jgi:biopolymer transport protein ExbD